MNGILEEITRNRMDNFRNQEIEALAFNPRKKGNILARFQEISGKKIGIIAELKKASPSAGEFPSTDRDARLKVYQESGVQALSILTEPSYFHGSYADLAAAISITDVPVLCKDFIVSREQLALASKIGSSAALIIAKIDASLQLVGSCLDLGMMPLIEIHDEIDLQKIIPVLECHPRARFIGVNNRNLDNFDVNIDVSMNLIPRVKDALGDDPIVISESGIKTREDVLKVCKAGASGFLIGTTLMNAGLDDVPSIIEAFQRP
ncbi:MAG: indole-3-glycerol-phosphate synthase [Promethearchaeota archaeon]